MKSYKLCINCCRTIEKEVIDKHYRKCFTEYYYKEYERVKPNNWFIRKVDIEKTWT